MARSRKPERWRTKLVANAIRQVRGKPLLEALFSLQGGLCAYDRSPCLLLIQPSEEIMALGLDLSRAMKERFATIDHVIPRSQGGANNLHNYVMSSQVKNCEKGSEDGWIVATKRWSTKTIERQVIQVEQNRWIEAENLARGISTKQDALRVVVESELARLYRNEALKEIYKTPALPKIKTEQSAKSNGKKTQAVKKRRKRRYRPKPVRPRRTVKDRL